MFQTLIFIDMKSKGEFPISIILAVQLVCAFNTMAAFLATGPVSIFGMKNALLTSQFFVCVFLWGIVGFNEYE